MSQLTTCLNCKKSCHPSELDSYYECHDCQFKFLKKIKSLSKDNISNDLKEQILDETAKKLGDSIKTVELLLPHLSRKFGIKVTIFKFSKLIKEELRKEKPRKFKFKFRYKI